MRYQGKLNGQVIKRFQREYVQGRAEHFPQSISSLQEGIWATQRTAGSKRHFEGGRKVAWVWEERRMSSASVISEGAEELGALQVKKNSSPWEKPARSYSGKDKYFKGVRNCKKFVHEGER